MKYFKKIKFEPIFGLGKTDDNLIDKKIQELLDAKQVNKEFKDVGKRVSGSKKEKRAYKIVKFLDLHLLEEDPQMAQEVVTKDRVYPVVDVQAERDRGVSSGAAYFKAALRNACSKQTQNNPKSRAGYVKTINLIVEDLEKCKTIDEIKKVTLRYLNWTSSDFLTILFDPQGFEGKTDDEIKAYMKDKFYTTSMHSSLVSKTFKLTFGQSFANLIFRQSDSALIHWNNAKKYQAVSKQEGELYLTKHIETNERYIALAEEKITKANSLSGNELWLYLNSIYSVPPSFKQKSTELLRGEIIKIEGNRIKRLTETKNNPDKFQMEHADMWEWFDGEKVKKEKEVNPERKINSGIPLAHIERKGGITIPANFLNDARITNETKHPLFSVFGFKSVQFGNAQTDTESREHMRHFLGAITDLGEILDIDVKQFNQLGSLSMAFATRGTGSANATYCVGKKIINLTNKRGDGTFAHEWGHYLDNILTMLYKSSTSNSHGMASVLRNSTSRMEGVIVNKSEDARVQEAMEEIMNFIYTGKEGVSKGYEKRFFALKEPKHTFSTNRITGQPENFESKGTVEETFKYYAAINSIFWKKQKDRFFQDLQSEYIQSLITILKIPYFDVVFKGNTSDYWQYSAMLASTYWTEPEELFARAWETYIFDKLDKVGRSNNYLTSDNYFKKFRIATGQSVCVYPESLEREYLFNLFDKLISVIKKQYNLGSFVPFSNARKDEFEAFEPEKEKKGTFNFETLKAALMTLKLT